MTIVDPMRDTVEQARSWMFDLALPFWLEQGVDRVNGGYVEMFDADGRASADYKRTRVMARQLYVFSHAAMHGVEGALDAARHGYVFLRDNARIEGGLWARRVSTDGRVIDPTPDLYDHAFMLFALGWYARASAEREPLLLAHQSLDALEAVFAHPKGGYLHEVPMSGPRLQNPHMHLLEGALSLCGADPNDDRFRVLSDNMANLFRTRFFDGRTLAEYFEDDWERAPGIEGRKIEPGHQFEWAWILRNYMRLSGNDMTREICALYEFAERYGVDARTGVTANIVLDDGSPFDSGSRTWPNTERIKGALAYADLTGADTSAAVRSATRVLFERHLDARGTWAENFDAQGRRTSDTVPVSTLYHVFLAFSELLDSAR